MWTFRGFNHFFQTVTVETKFNSSVHLKNSESRPSAGCWGINEQLPVCVTMFYYTPFRVYYCVSVCGWVTLFYYMCVLKSVLLCVCARACVWRHKGLSGFPRTKIFGFLETNLGRLPGRRWWWRKKHCTLHTQFLQETFDLISQEKVQSNFIWSGFKGIVHCFITVTYSVHFQLTDQLSMTHISQ